MNTRKLLELVNATPLAKFDPFRFAVEIAAQQKEECAVFLEANGKADLAEQLRATE
jgi:hypothetical protein